MLSILLQATAQEGGPMGQYGSLIMMALIFVVFYFFMIRPQMKKQKEIKKFRDSIAIGDKVITSGGIYGKVKDIKQDSFVLEIAENVRVTVDKNSVFATAADAPTTR
ncbi:MAG: preprotein translocase subunit YajC [Paludibacteraceae bacterium]|mgnify:FL=1|jgi:preprotein translocase subunit YajC|nr:preprotein translocase subunit YajC [Paludibacteraceae bacterium]NLK91990.1 preprotein translocase subunit YajC [Bacteroidales bacterium]MBP6437102.1 preprotein translocase subunit YajC [Paludibacteraceae bacterium]MBP8627175.1 preprotein translocase subunit YajC [Paludibacteraceae bacterium]MBP8782105.1 preprotein translocase subunit YajC [Paludibacteraceae bacterium]